MGYVPEDYVIHDAGAVGFKLVGRSEIKSTPTGAAVGESDRMTLKFEKPPARESSHSGPR